MVSIPYGKGKGYLEETVHFDGKDMYQFPMGKVKLGTSLWTDIQVIELSYQFPMGKVKLRYIHRGKYAIRVSIPYGKGKEQHFVFFF